MEFDNTTLSIKQVSEFLLKNEEKYNEIQKPIKCIARTLPCMCFVRDKDCLFIDIFEKLALKYKVDSSYKCNITVFIQFLSENFIGRFKTKSFSWSVV